MVKGFSRRLVKMDSTVRKFFPIGGTVDRSGAKAVLRRAAAEAGGGPVQGHAGARGRFRNRQERRARRRAKWARV